MCLFMKSVSCSMYIRDFFEYSNSIGGLPSGVLATMDCILARRRMAVAEFAGRARGGSSMTEVIYRIPTWLLGVLIVGLSSGLSALGLIVVHRLVPLENRRSHNDVAGYLSNIAAFVYAVLLAFIAVATWQD